MCVAKLVDTTVVPKSNANGHEIAGQTKSMQDPAVSAKPTGTDTSLAQKAGSLSMPLVRKTLNNRNLSSAAKEIIMASCRRVENGIDVLASLYKDGLGYSAINTTRSALSSVLTLPGNVTFGNHPLVTRFPKGIFELKPSLPRYNRIWDVSVVLGHLKTLEPVYALDLKALTLKLTMLLCLLTGQRCQTLSKLDITLMQKLPRKYVFTIGKKLKTTRPG